MKTLPFLASIALFALGCATAVEPGSSERAVTSDDALKGGCRVECPKCRPNEPCPAMACVMVCPEKPTRCGDATCAPGQVCCNESCGICTERDGVCTQQICGQLPGCTTDADCRLFDDYCTGCDCRSLLETDPDPVCDGPGVRCFAQPCGGKTAVCVAGECLVQ